MPVSTIQIREMLHGFGWELLEARTIAQLWIAEIWLIKSIWSPTDCRVFLTFEIDGQANPRDVSQIWAVNATLSRPDDWLTDGGYDIEVGNSTGNLSIAKEKHLDILFDELANLRNKFVSSAH